MRPAACSSSASPIDGALEIARSGRRSRTGTRRSRRRRPRRRAPPARSTRARRRRGARATCASPDVVPLLEEQARRDRGVDAPRHRDQHGPFAVIAGQATRVSFRRDRGPVRRPDGRRAELPARRAGRRARGHRARRGPRRARGRRAARPHAGCGSPGSSPTRRRPGSIPRSPSARAPAAARAPSSRSPGSAMFEGRQETALPDPPEDAPTGDAGARGRPRSTAPPTTPRSRGSASTSPPATRTRSTTRCGCTPTVQRRPPRPVPRPLPRAARRLRRLPRHRPAPGALRLTRAVLPDRRRRRSSTRPMKGTAPRGRWLAEDLDRRGPPAGLGEGPRRERDDRGPAPQRHRPGGARRVGDAGPTSSRPSATRPCGS